jgi:hypothetical protein
VTHHFIKECVGQNYWGIQMKKKSKDNKEAFKNAASNMLSFNEEDLKSIETDRRTPQWNAENWDGLSEDDAFEEDPLSVLIEMGTEIAAQSWSGGSWSNVYEYRGRYYAVDEGGMDDYDHPREAFERAGIGRETFDTIIHLDVAPDFEQWIIDDTAKK